MGDVIQAAADAIHAAEALFIGAGAGMGVDSGLPDFRGNEGFWRAYPAFRRAGLSFVDMANPAWFRDDPRIAWGFYGHRLNLYRRTEPHHGFCILRGWGERMAHGAFVFTSNVDGQFQRGGFPADRLVECHGSIHHMQCAAGCDGIWDGGGVRVDVDEENFCARPPLPVCSSCGAVARPNILMFGDWSWLGERTARQEAELGDWLDRVGSSRLVVVELGAGTAVPTVRSTCERLAERSGAPLVRINPRDAHGPAGTISIYDTALAALRAVDALIPA